jgi:hypothetical protein
MLELKTQPRIRLNSLKVRLRAQLFFKRDEKLQVTREVTLEVTLFASLPQKSFYLK